MVYEVRDEWTIDNCFEEVIAYDEKQVILDSDVDLGDPVVAGTMTFYLRPIPGKAAREIADKMYDQDKKGRGSFKAGTSAMGRVLAGVVAIKEGDIIFRGEAVTEMTRPLYDWLDEAVTNRIYLRLKKISKDLEDEEQE